ncbi:MAG: LysM peptidoglycan-binding domain-containing protein [Actinomycetaceae bacterium]|nr:LysM peptidoglycan-binding domain-containing protein [Actinomycetaceae bacterium]
MPNLSTLRHVQPSAAFPVHGSSALEPIPSSGAIPRLRLIQGGSLGAPDSSANPDKQEVSKALNSEQKQLKGVSGIFSRALLWTFFAVVALLLGGGAGFALSPSADAVPVGKYVVAPGDTLWSIAQRHTALGTEIGDALVHIQEVNGLETQVLQVGQVLKIPAL